MINYVEHNVTDVTHGIVAHGVNCQRKMGSGVAKAIRAKWPIAYDRYMAFGLQGKDALGLTHIIEVDEGLWVANCYTQEYYGYDKKRYASLSAVKNTLEEVFGYAALLNVPVYLPKIGCGRGGLKWEAEVEPLINSLSKAYEIPTYVCIWRDDYDRR